MIVWLLRRLCILILVLGILLWLIMNWPITTHQQVQIHGHWQVVAPTVVVSHHRPQRLP